MKFDLNDIITKPESEWQEINKRITYKSIIMNQDKFQKDMDSFMHFISLPLSVFSKSNAGAVDATLQTNIYQLMLSGYYLLFKDQSIKQTKKYLSDPNSQVVLETWNGMDKVLPMKFWAGANNPYMKFHEIVYLHKNYKPLTIEKVTNWAKNKSILKREQLEFVEAKNRNIYQQTTSEDKVQVRILCSETLQQKQKPQPFYNSIINKVNCVKNNFKTKEEIIIHIHGGGWVSMSSYSHQMYTRRWANNKVLQNTPIFSIDYRLSPKYAYPCALDDIWQAYLFIIKDIDQYFNINPKKIILAGDSAGGNMVLGICQLCMKYGIRQPDGLILSYPALNLSITKYTPSINASFNDFITPFPFLEVCLKLYMQDPQCDPVNDTLLSPIFSSNEFFKKLPTIRFNVGEFDMLKDDCLRFMHKLIQNNHQDSNIIIYNTLKHGYLNWDLPFVFPVTRKCSSDIAEQMAKIFSFQ